MSCMSLAGSDSPIRIVPKMLASMGDAGDGRNDHTKEIAGSEEPDGQLLGISDADDTLLKSN